MTFTVVDQMKTRFPDKDIYLFSTQDFCREQEEKSVYKFNILPFDWEIKIGALDSFGNLLRKIRRGDDSKHIDNCVIEVIRNAAFFIDISGFSLTSDFNFRNSFSYLLNIVIAKKFSVPYYIFPQSIGPFDYPMRHKIYLYPLMRLYLKYPEKIFPREEEGLNYLHRFTKRNVEKGWDIVLQSKGYNLSNIFNKKINFKDIKVQSNGVGIVPNLRVIERATTSDIYSIYYSLINRLIETGRRVYILRHSYEDLDVCETIKASFRDEKGVELIPDDLSAIELENIIKQFDFIITSRYHSIVHAYKNGVPALVIGWATKYLELLENFDQLDYFFDVRNNILVDEIDKKLVKLMQSCIYEKQKITNKMKTLTMKNIFNIFDR